MLSCVQLILNGTVPVQIATSLPQGYSVPYVRPVRVYKATNKQTKLTFNIVGLGLDCLDCLEPEPSSSSSPHSTIPSPQSLLSTGYVGFFSD